MSNKPNEATATVAAPAPITLPPPTGPLPPTFPAREALAAQGILTYKDLSAFAPDYRITGIDAATADLIATELAKPQPDGVAARVCLTRDHVIDAIAVRDGDFWNIHAPGVMLQRAHGPVDRPTQPGEFALAESIVA